MTEIIETTFKLRRGTKEAWDRNNPVLADGEPGFATNANLLKIGDGVTPWKDLEPANAEFGSGGLSREIVDVLPEVSSADVDKIYMVKKEDESQSGNVYEEYMVINGAWEKIGDTQVDLSGYVTRDELVQPDWEQHDETADDFIKNRPCYRERFRITHYFDKIPTFGTHLDSFWLFKDGEWYTISINGYEFEAGTVRLDETKVVLRTDKFEVVTSGEETRIMPMPDYNGEVIGIYTDGWDIYTLPDYYISSTFARTEKVHELINEAKVQPNWNQHDETADDYIQNRPCYFEMKETKKEVARGQGWDLDLYPYMLKPKATYTVSIDGIEYTGVTNDNEEYVEVEFGNICSAYSDINMDESYLSMTDGEDVEHDFVLYEHGDTNVVAVPLADELVPDTVHHKYEVTKTPIFIGTVKTSKELEELVDIYPQNKNFMAIVDNIQYTDVVLSYDEGDDSDILTIGGIEFRSSHMDSCLTITCLDKGTHDVALYETTSTEIEIDEKFLPSTIARSAESHGLAMDDVSGEFVSAAEFNALLAILRDAGYLASSGALPPA